MNDCGRSSWHRGEVESSSLLAPVTQSGGRGDCRPVDDFLSEVILHGASGIQNSLRIVVLDDDIRRRGAIAHCLAGVHFFVEPLERVSEIASLPYKPDIFLAHGVGTLITLLVTELSRLKLSSSIIAYSEMIKLPEVVKSIQQGACDYLEWPIDRDRLLDTIIHEVAQAAGPAIEADCFKVVNRRLQSLTRREQQIIDCYLQEMRPSDIVTELKISEGTLACHKSSIRRKLGWSKDANFLKSVCALRNQAKNVSEVSTDNVFEQVAPRPDGGVNLTDREMQILSFVARGWSSKEIAKHLGISSRTIECHRGNFIVKFKAKNSLEAVHIAKEMKII